MTEKSLSAISQDTSQAVHAPRRIASYNLMTQEPLGEVSSATPEMISQAMQTARHAQTAWAARPLQERLNLLRQFRNLLYQHLDAVLQVLMVEQGKVAPEAMGEVVALLEGISFYLHHAKKILKPRRPFVRLLPHRRHIIEHRPYGVALIISPWNYPVLLPMTPVVAALIAGNTVILKPSEFVPQISELLTRLLHQAGFPKDVFQLVHGYGDVGAALIEARPDRICFTGSETTGRKIAAQAGDLLIPATLELGGKDAALVLEDANIQRSARGIVWASSFNSGQTCQSIERVYVMRPIAEALIMAMKKVMDEEVYPGPSTHARSTYGPTTTEPQFKIIEKHLAEAVELHARIITGKNRADGRYHPPAIVTDIPEDATIVTEETFGPVFVVIPTDTEEEMIQKVNASRFGLTASIWTEDNPRGLRIGRKMDVGVVSLNDHILSAAAPEMPWGGRKASGYGRTRSHEGLLEMTVPVAMSYERFRVPFEIFWLPYTRLKSGIVRRIVHLFYGASWRDKLRAFNPFAK